MDLKQLYRTKSALVETFKAKHANKRENFSASQDPACWEGQPTDGKSLYIVSKDNEQRSTTAGAVCLAVLDLAALRIVEGSHEIATPEQIAAQLQAEAKRGRELAAMERAAMLRRQGAFNVD
jgi:hypothetical protein